MMILTKKQLVILKVLFIKLSLGVGCFFSLYACSQKELYAKGIYQLDSTLIVLSIQQRAFRTIDSSEFKKALLKFETLKTFITTNISDTLTKEEATTLHQFYTSGEFLFQFDPHRKEAIVRLTELNGQLKSLIKNGEEGRLPIATFNDDVHYEVNAAKLLDQVLNQSLLNYRKELQNFKAILPALETLVKSRNRGNLPFIIQDTLSM
jgi:hypothetical protein